MRIKFINCRQTGNKITINFLVSWAEKSWTNDNFTIENPVDYKDIKDKLKLYLETKKEEKKINKLCGSIMSDIGKELEL